MMLADIHANNHSIDECNAISNTIGPSNYYIALGPSLDLASDSSINLISTLPVTITSSNLDMNGNNIVNIPELSLTVQTSPSVSIANTCKLVFDSATN